MVAKSPAARHYWVLWDTLEVHRDVLFKRFRMQDGTAEYLQLVVPQSLKEDILFQMHNSVISGHLGCKKTKARVLQKFYWFGLREDIALYIRKCDICAADKKPMKTPHAPMGSLKAGAPGDCVATDYLGPLPIGGGDREESFKAARRGRGYMCLRCFSEKGKNSDQYKNQA